MCENITPQGSAAPQGHTFRQPVKLPFTCRICGKTVWVTAEADDIRKWNTRKTHIQDCFPYLSPAQRELFLSGICGECWDKLVKPPMA